VTISSDRIKVLMYADDMVLLADDKRTMQQMIDAIVRFEAFGYTSISQR